MEDATARNISDFVSASHDILGLVLARLSNAFRLGPSDDLRTMHRKSGQSGDHCRLIKYTPVFSTPARDPHLMFFPHTDFGTLTLVYSKQPGLEIYSHEQGQWQPVMPRPDCVVVNVGDALHKFTNGILRSCLHRVTYRGPLAGKGKTEKYSLAYFLRPEDGVLLAPLTSPLIEPLAADEAPVSIVDWTREREKSYTAAAFAETKDWSRLRGTAAGWN
jgi:isopenicillin N synthase-like dioxygenase